MSLGLLCLGITLLGALQTHAKNFDELIKPPSPSQVPLQPNFRDDRFQGKWYVVGVGLNTFVKEGDREPNMHATTYDLKEDHTYNITITLLRGEQCEHFIRSFVPTSRSGQYSLGHLKEYYGLQSYTMQVVETDYDQYAILYFKKVSSGREYFKTTLYGRGKELPSELKEKFVDFAHSLGLDDDRIFFTVPIDTCIDGQ